MIEDKLDTLLDEFDLDWRTSVKGIDEYESLFIEVVNTCKKHMTESIMSDYFVSRLRQGCPCCQLFQFCMRVFQLPRVKEEAMKIKGNTSDFRTITAMNVILQVYEEHWE
jgi:hypothetical protein